MSSAYSVISQLFGAKTAKREKRRHPRSLCAYQTAVVFRLADGGRRRVLGAIVNISISGLLFRLSNPLDIGQDSVTDAAIEFNSLPARIRIVHIADDRVHCAFYAPLVPSELKSFLNRHGVHHTTSTSVS